MPLSGLMEPWGSAIFDATKSYFSYSNDNNLKKNRKIEYNTITFEGVVSNQLLYCNDCCECQHRD